MKSIIAAVFVLILAFSPAGAAPREAEPAHDLSDVSKETLEQGLRASGVCMAIEGYGIIRFVKFYEDNKDEDAMTANRAALTAGMLYGAFQREKTLARAVIKVFKTKYAMTSEDIGKLTKDEIEAEQADLKKKYDDVDDYDEFVEAFEETLTNCSNAVTSFTNKIKKELGIPDEEPPAK